MLNPHGEQYELHSRQRCVLEHHDSRVELKAISHSFDSIPLNNYNNRIASSASLVSHHSNSSFDSEDNESNKSGLFFRFRKTVATKINSIGGRKRQSRFHGWQWGILTGACTAAVVLVLNVVLVAVGMIKGSGYRDGVVTLFTGDTGSIASKSTWLHVLINVLSTLLLSASNYAMQVLSSPTRKECEAAHQKGHWLDVGILSWRNLKSVSKRRRGLWWVFGISSIPLHLFYNASVFKVTSGNDYSIELVEFKSSEFESLKASSLRSPSDLHILTYAELKSAYGQKYVSQYGDVSLAIEQISVTMGISDYHATENYALPAVDFSARFLPSDSQEWAQNITNDGWVTADILDALWAKGFNSTAGSQVSLRIGYAFARRGARNSKIQMSLPFMMVVISCNIIKLACLVFMLLDLHEELPLVTVGDAIASFLTDPEPSTAAHGTYSKKDFLWKYKHTERRTKNEKKGRVEKLDKRCEGVWERRIERYGRIINKSRRIFAAMLCIGLILITPVAFCVIAITSTGFPGQTSPYLLSWGTLSTVTIFPMPNNDSYTMLLTFIANSPQLLVSLLYLTYNNIFTCMALSYEYNHFGLHRKALRVTKPFGAQRETYFLQLPLRFGVPLNALGGLLHWLTSQMIFVVRLDKFDSNGSLKADDSVAACGFSGSPLLALIGVQLVLVIIITVLGFWKFETRVPTAGSCSWAISAACHPSKEEVDPALGKVRWGVVPKGRGDKSEVEHCSFTSGPTKRPKVGRTYK